MQIICQISQGDRHNHIYHNRCDEHLFKFSLLCNFQYSFEFFVELQIFLQLQLRELLGFLMRLMLLELQQLIYVKLNDKFAIICKKSNILTGCGQLVFFIRIILSVTKCLVRSSALSICFSVIQEEARILSVVMDGKSSQEYGVFRKSQVFVRFVC